MRDARRARRAMTRQMRRRGVQNAQLKDGATMMSRRSKIRGRSAMSAMPDVDVQTRRSNDIRARLLMMRV